jgi:hypothetical protein
MKTIDKQAGDPPPPDMSGKENQIAIDEVTLAAGVAADRNDKSESDRVNATTPEMIRIVNRGVSLQIESIKQSGGMLKQYERMDTLFDRWGDPQFTGGAKMLDPDVRNEANHTAKASLSILDSNMRKDMQEARENGIPINVSMDNGEVSFDTDKFTYPKVTNTSEAVKSVNELTGRSSYVRGLTSKVSRRVRKARRALANINGWKGDDPRLDKLIQKYMPNLSQELDNNEKGIVTPTIDKDQQARDKAEEQKQNYNTFEEEPNEKKKIPLRTL